MIWRDKPIQNDPNGRPMWHGSIELTDDKDYERFASIMWSSEEGPFYAYALDFNDRAVIRRIGPHYTLEAAKHQCIEAIEGRLNISNRAGYPR